MITLYKFFVAAWFIDGIIICAWIHDFMPLGWILFVGQLFIAFGPDDKDNKDDKNA